MSRGRALSSMSIRDLEDAGQRFYAAKGIMNGEQAEGDEHDECRGCYSGCDECDPTEPVETITESDLHPSQWEGVEGYTATQDDHDQMEAMYVDFAERVW